MLGYRCWSWRRLLAFGVLGFWVSSVAALPGVLDQVHRRHGGIYSQIHREATSTNPGVTKVVASVSLKGLAEDPMWQRYLQELPRVNAARLVAGDYHDRVAFWLNTRNAAMLRAIVERVHPDDQKPTLTGLGDWPLQPLEVAGRTISLREAEDQLLSLGEPMVLFGICTGSETSPPWPTGPFTANGWQVRLIEQGRDWVANPRVLRLDHGRRVLHLTREFQNRIGWLRSVENALPMDASWRLYPKDHGLILALLSPVLQDQDLRRLKKNRYRIQWQEESDALLLH